MARPDGPFREGKVHVREEKCSTCVFRPGNLMRLGAARLREILEDNLELDSALQCHQTLDYSKEQLPPAVCRGFYDHPRADESLAMRLAHSSESTWVEFDS